MNTSPRLPRDQVLALRPGDVELHLTSRGWLIEEERAQIEVLPPIRALAEARTDDLESVRAYNCAPIRFKRAIGQVP